MAEPPVANASPLIIGIQYLLTWNCAHIANAQRREAIEEVCRDAGYGPPLICTPEEMMGGEE